MLKLTCGTSDCYDWRGTVLVKVTSALAPRAGASGPDAPDDELRYSIKAMAGIRAVVELLSRQDVTAASEQVASGTVDPGLLAPVIERLAAVLPGELSGIAGREAHDLCDVAVRAVVGVGELYRNGLEPIGFSVDHVSLFGGYAGEVPILCASTGGEVVHCYLVTGAGIDAELLGRRAALLAAAEHVVGAREELLDAPAVKRAAVLVTSGEGEEPDAFVESLGDLRARFPWALAQMRCFQDTHGLRDAGRGAPAVLSSSQALERPVAWLKLGARDASGKVARLDSFRITSRRRSVIEALQRHLGGHVVEGQRGAELWDAGTLLPVVLYPGSLRVLWEHLEGDRILYCEAEVLRSGEPCPYPHEPGRLHRLVTDLTVRLGGAEHLGCVSLRSKGKIAREELAREASALLCQHGTQANAALWVDRCSSGGRSYVVPRLSPLVEPGVLYTWPLKAPPDERFAAAVRALYGSGRQPRVVLTSTADTEPSAAPGSESTATEEAGGPEGPPCAVGSSPHAVAAVPEPVGQLSRAARLLDELGSFVGAIAPGEIAGQAAEVLASLDHSANCEEIIEAAKDVKAICLAGVGADIVDAALPWRQLLDRHDLERHACSPAPRMDTAGGADQVSSGGFVERRGEAFRHRR